MNLYSRVRSRQVLHRAWAKVRASGLNSDSERTLSETRRFDAAWLSNLDRIRDQLKKETFVFSGERGITPPKGQGKQGVRPIVLAPIANRIVRRAVLEVLQGYGKPLDPGRRRWSGVSAVCEVMATRTSVGGIPERGVPHGLALIDEAVRSGHSYFVRSDIKNFFTRIPVRQVSNFIRQGVSDDEAFARLFEQALITSLENEDELREREMFLLFPNPEIGVAQGSALSALAGNIILRQFDDDMNGRGIICVRYIDDFILLGSSHTKVLSAYDSARRLLKSLNMDVYELSDGDARKAGKVDDGNIFNGTDILGYRISGNSRQPCQAATFSLLAKIDAVVHRCKVEMRTATESAEYLHSEMYAQSVAKIHRIVWGWSQSFKHSTARQVFERMDRQVDGRLQGLRSEFESLASTGDVYRRILGVHLLADTRIEALPELAAASQHSTLQAA